MPEKVEIVPSASAEEWVRGVGEGGVGEWVDMMRRLLKRAEERRAEERSRL